MKAVININGVVGVDATLLGAIREFKSFKNPTEVEVLINSNGGDVNEGKAIFSFLRNLNLPITTRATRAYSIAASIFMAGEVRLLEEGANRLMIHMPWGSVSGGSAQFEAATKQLRQIEEDFIEFYSKHTKTDKKSIKRLLENQTYLSSEDAITMGIATGSFNQLKAVAFYNDNNNEEKTNGIMNKAETLVQAIKKFLSPTIQALVVKDANGEDVNFPELELNDNPEIGDKVADREGAILMPDGSTINVVSGAIESITPAEEAPVEEVEEVAVEEAPVEEEVEEAPAEEEVEEAPAEEEVEEAPAEEEEVVEDIAKLIREMEEKIMEKISAQFTEKEKVMEAEILALKKSIGSDLENEPTTSTTIKHNSQSGNYLTNALKKRKG